MMRCVNNGLLTVSNPKMSLALVTNCSYSTCSAISPFAGNTSAFKWDDECAATLSQIVQAAGASLVLMSSWRQDDARMRRMPELLATHSLPPLLGVTPVLGKEHSARGDEILQWLEANGGARPWVAIDDGPLHVRQYKHDVAARQLKLRHVRTSSAQGLTAALAEVAIDLLTRGM